MKRVRCSRQAGAATAVLLMLAVLPSAHAAWSQNVSTDPDSGVTIRLRSMLNKLPARGYFPVQATIRNGGSRDGEWSVQFSSAPTYALDLPAARTESRIWPVPRREERTFEAMIPLYPATHRLGTAQVSGQFAGPGVERGSHFQFNGNHSDFGGLFVALAPGLAQRNEGAIDATVISQRVARVTTATLNMDALSADLRAYSGIDTIIMPRATWDGLDPAYRHVIRQWLIQGGQLLLATRDLAEEQPPADLADGTGTWPDQWHFGWGEVGGVAMASDNEIDPVALIKRVVGHHNVTDELLNGYQKHSWPLRDDIPDIVQPVGLLLFVVVAIAVVIGPLNLFLAARSKRPTRVIWTTPALSLAASLLLIVIIVLAEGFGGQGRRFTVLFLHAGERTASLIQEQVSRTGVLLRRDFALPADAVLHRAITFYPDDQTGRFNFSAAGAYGGDWFSSRSLTAQVIQHTGPSRSGIQLWRHGDRPPEVFSSVDLPLQRIYLMDKTGAVWKTDSLQAGESRTLTPATRAELLMWWRDRQALAGGLTRALFKSPGLLIGRFYAEAEPDRNYPLPTLASIRWVDDRVLVTGTMIDKEAP